MALSYCGEMVRKYDPDRFLLTLFVPAERREALWALYAFNHEIAKTREVVTETQLGLIRLQWWRDAIAGIYGQEQVPEHQVLIPLAEAIREHRLPRESFDNLVYAREFDLEDRLPASLEGMEKYAEFTSAPLLSLAMAVLGGKPPEDEVQKAAAVYAMTGLLRAVPAHLRQRRCYLPEDLIQAQGMTVYDLYDGTGIEKLKPVVKTVVERIGGVVPDLRESGFSRLHVNLADMYLGQIESAGYDVFSARLNAPPFLRELRLWWAAL